RSAPRRARSSTPAVTKSFNRLRKAKRKSCLGRGGPKNARVARTARAAARLSSLRLCADRAHELAQALGFGGNERRELLRRGGVPLGHSIGNLPHTLRILPRRHERSIELGDNALWRARRGDEAEPGVERQSGKARLRHRRNIRQRRQTFR